MRIEVMKQALEALELHAEQYPHMQKGYTVDAITALRTAIEQAEKQEPVAWIFKPNREFLWPNEVERKNPLELNEYVPLYTTPPAAQREWVGLTYDEIWRCFKLDYMHSARAIEAKLKEKNHAD